MNKDRRKQFIEILRVLYILPTVADALLLSGGWPMDFTDDFKENAILISVRLEFLLGLVTYLSFYFSKKEKPHSFLWIIGFINGIVGVLSSILVTYRSYYVDKITNEETILVINVLFGSFVLMYMTAIGYYNYSLYVIDQSRRKQEV